MSMRRSPAFASWTRPSTVNLLIVLQMTVQRWNADSLSDLHCEYCRTVAPWHSVPRGMASLFPHRRITAPLPFEKRPPYSASNADNKLLRRIIGYLPAQSEFDKHHEVRAWIAIALAPASIAGTS